MTLIFFGGCMSQSLKPSSQKFSRPINNQGTLLLVESKTPWYAPNFLVKRAFKKAVPEYQAVNGLTRKAFTIGHDGLFGGLYTWENRQIADSYYNEERIQSVEKKRGMRPRLTFFKIQSFNDYALDLPVTDIKSSEWDGDFVVSIKDLQENLGHLDEVKINYVKKMADTNQKGLVTSYLASTDAGKLFEIL